MSALITHRRFGVLGVLTGVFLLQEPLSLVRWALLAARTNHKAVDFDWVALCSNGDLFVLEFIGHHNGAIFRLLFAGSAVAVGTFALASRRSGTLPLRLLWLSGGTVLLTASLAALATLLVIRDLSATASLLILKGAVLGYAACQTSRLLAALADSEDTSSGSGERSLSAVCSLALLACAFLWITPVISLYEVLFIAFRNHESVTWRWLFEINPELAVLMCLPFPMANALSAAVGALFGYFGLVAMTPGRKGGSFLRRLCFASSAALALAAGATFLLLFTLTHPDGRDYEAALAAALPGLLVACALYIAALPTYSASPSARAAA